MTIDEAIKHCREVANSQNQSAKLIENNIYIPKSVDKYDMVYDCQQCAEEHEQLADWLEELKMRRELDKEQRKIGNIEGFNKGYNKAIDDFNERLEAERTQCYNFDDEEHLEPIRCVWWDDVEEITKQMKGGQET